MELIEAERRFEEAREAAEAEPERGDLWAAYVPAYRDLMAARERERRERT